MHNLLRLALPALAALTAATGAHAEDPATYVRLTAGATSAGAAQPRVDFGGGVAVEGDLSDRTGVQFGGALGRAWGWARLEAEYQYGVFQQRDPTLGGASAKAKGDARYHSGMVNAYATVPVTGSLGLFAGAGAGLAHVRTPGLKPSPTCACFSAASRTAFAYQARAGAEWRLRRADAVLVQYNHLRLPGSSGGVAPRTHYAARGVQAVSIGYLHRF